MIYRGAESRVNLLLVNVVSIFGESVYVIWGSDG